MRLTAMKIRNRLAVEAVVCGIGDHDLPGLGKFLQPCRNVDAVPGDAGEERRDVAGAYHPASSFGYRWRDGK